MGICFSRVWSLLKTRVHRHVQRRKIAFSINYRRKQSLLENNLTFCMCKPIDFQRPKPSLIDKKATRQEIILNLANPHRPESIGYWPGLLAEVV